MENSFKYIPSVSAGYLFSGILTNKVFANGMDYAYYNYEGKYAYPYFLIPAANNLRQSMAKKARFFETPDQEIFGDSGGFQIANNTVKWQHSLLEQTFNWLEENSTVAAILDIPPRGNIYSFNESLDITVSNTEYFHEKQSGRTKFLNVLQGANLPEREQWYDRVKHFKDFHGWAVGDVSNLLKIYTSYYSLLKYKEHLRSRVIHYLGASGTDQFVLLAHIQNALNKIGCDVQIYSDSSSPNSARFGYYYTDINYKQMNWRTLHVPYIRTTNVSELKGDNNLTRDQKVEIFHTDSNTALPLFTDFDKEVFINMFTHDDLITYNERFCAALILRNIHVYKAEVDKINRFVQAPEYYRINIFNAEIAALGTAINKMTEVSDSPIELEKVYNKYLPLFRKYESFKIGNTQQHDFF